MSTIDSKNRSELVPRNENIFAGLDEKNSELLNLKNFMHNYFFKKIIS